jgi:hypothetical protein
VNIADQYETHERGCLWWPSRRFTGTAQGRFGKKQARASEGKGLLIVNTGTGKGETTAAL